MIKKLILAIGMMATTYSVSAGLVLNLDGVEYPLWKSLVYDVESRVLYVDFDASQACSGNAISEPGSQLTLNIDNQLYALNGPVTIDLTASPPRLVIASAVGDVECEADRIFGDFFFLSSLN